ncbi:DegT/DnrJ/EryC1/StrS family aminotransferase [Paenibacillus senegalensis]|uniref:DegT/DnrJ/EryC1/StrS family aminotransferase n=1 Tax=Paenibacillus senegalensis TaxID=1465766 RepID=UPI000289BE4A|nr:DegT/DnrJ/EryC1/StrS family aminotransferase [Paenibacillus senegalensis]
MEKLAIDGGTPVRSRPWNAQWPEFGELERKLVLEVVDSGHWGGVFPFGSQKEKVPQLESQFAQLHNCKHAIGVPNGTLAITIALQAAGVKPGDEVIVPPYTFIATASAPLLFGAIPVFVDIEEETLLLDPEKVESAITPKTKAIIAVHIAGCPANMSRLKEIAGKHGLVLIEDAAQAVGAEWEGHKVGSIGDLGTFSLQSSKNLNAGEGGIVTTNNTSYWEQAWSIVNIGRIPSGEWYQHERLGQNYRLTEFQAAIALAQMTRLEEQMARREKNVALLNQLLASLDGIQLLTMDPRVTRHANHLYLFKLERTFCEMVNKSEFIRKVNAEGIPLTEGYSSLNLNASLMRTIEELTGEKRINECPVSERICQSQSMWLAQTVLLEDENSMYDIANALDKVVRSYH